MAWGNFDMKNLDTEISLNAQFLFPVLLPFFFGIFFQHAVGGMQNITMGMTSALLGRPVEPDV